MSLRSFDASQPNRSGRSSRLFAQSSMKREKILAWGVHLYTATGLLLAAWMAVLIVRGGDDAFRAAFALMILATFIDSTDGWLARRAQVKRVVPTFDGRRLDDIVDFHTYTTLPLMLIWRAGVLPAQQSWWLLVPLLASAYGFSQVNAKTDDGFFLGFPSYWNVVSFYLYMLQPPVWLSVALIVGLSILTFVPSRYLYPSHGSPFSRLTILLGAVWTAVLLLIFVRWDTNAGWLTILSLGFPLYYMILSWALTLQHRWRKRSARRAGADEQEVRLDEVRNH
jgi:phosphatidylcholine synthase